MTLENVFFFSFLQIFISNTSGGYPNGSFINMNYSYFILFCQDLTSEILECRLGVNLLRPMNKEFTKASKDPI
jgi:hypothetical protein